MKKIYAIAMMAMMVMTASAQEQNDTTYVMLDFNQNPWNYPVTTTQKGWGPAYDDDQKGDFYGDAVFTWPVAEGSDKLVTVTFSAVDLEENKRPNVLAYLENDEYKTVSGSDSLMTMFYANIGTTMRVQCPAGYKMGKMVFYNYRTANFLVGDDYDEKYTNASGFEVSHKFWTPALPKQNAYGYSIWEGDAQNALFNYPYFSAVFLKVDMRLVSDGTTAIVEHKAQNVKPLSSYTLDGRQVNASAGLKKGIYVIDGHKRVVK